MLRCLALGSKGGTVKTVTFAAAILLLAVQPLDAQEFRVGAAASDFTLLDMNRNSVSYSSLSASVTVVMFFSTRCPVSNAFNYRRNTLYKDYAGRVRFM